MLQLILGPAGSGKTGRLLGELKACALDGRAAILLVPEQFSSSAEAMVYEALGDAASAFVEVLSFRTLAGRILEACGGAAQPVMTDAARAVFVRRALDALGEGLRTFVRHKRDAAFCSLCASAIHELKTAGATAADLRAVGAAEGDGKLMELADIFEAYEAGIEGAAMDPADRLTLAAGRADSDYFEGKSFFIDNFDGFTGSEYLLLGPVLQHCDTVYAALCCDGLAETDGGLGLFSPVRRTAQRLLDAARKAGCRAAAPVVLHGRGTECGGSDKDLAADRPAGLSALAGLLAGNEAQDENQGLHLTETSDEWEEVRLAAAQMRRLALEGVPYARMAFVCRDMVPYEGPVRRLFELFEIPLFVDAPDTIEYTAPVAFARAALALLRQGLSTQPVLDLLKTGLCGFDVDAIAALENYAYTWRPTAADWRTPFEKNPEGLLAQRSAEGDAQLALAEGLRAALVPQLQAFLAAAKGVPAGRLSREIYLLLDRFDAPVHIEETAAALEREGDVPRAGRTRRAWDLAMDLLDQMSHLLGGEVLSPDEYDALLLILVRATDFGEAPQTLEAVTFTTADRMRLAAPGHVFVAGLCEGVFPMQVGASGLLTHEDRERLVRHGVEMPGSFENRVLLEDMFLYRAFTSASQSLYMSWPRRLAGVARVRCAALEPVAQALAPPPLWLPAELLSPTPGAAFDRLCEVYRGNTPEAAALWRALEGVEDTATADRDAPEDAFVPGARALEMIRLVDNTGQFAVRDRAMMNRMLGDTMTLSPTRAELYYSCRFAYYLERVLGVRPRRRAEVSPLESGTFVHTVLEGVLREAGDAFATLPDAELDALCTKHARAFADAFLPELDRRTRRLLERVEDATAKLVRYLRDGAAQSEFSIDALELPIADVPGGVPPLEVRLADGRRVRATGKVDRVDVLRRDGRTYLCIIDYKTGSKTLDLADIYCGLSMQMMVYMDTLCKNASERYPDAVPAAMLYLGSDPAPESGRREGTDETPLYRMNGLLLEDLPALRALEPDGAGLFIPVKYNRDGSPRKGAKLASFAKMGQITARVEELLAAMAEGVWNGAFEARPQVTGSRHPCEWCAYRGVCRHEDGRNELRVDPKMAVFEDEIAMGDATEPGGGADG